MSNIKTTAHLFQSYIKVKTITVTANKNILERALLVENFSKTADNSYVSIGGKEANSSRAKK